MLIEEGVEVDLSDEKPPTDARGPDVALAQQAMHGVTTDAKPLFKVRLGQQSRIEALIH